MSIFFKVSDTELLNIRNKIFFEYGIPALKKNNFEKSPFSTAWFGKNNLGDYTYELCRLSGLSNLEIVTTHISRGDKWIKIFLNIFILKPSPSSLKDLKGGDGLQYSLPPNTITLMRLREDDFKGIPSFNFVGHKIKSFYSKKSLEKRCGELSILIKEDLNNIDYFIKRWHEIHKPLVTNWEGK